VPYADGLARLKLSDGDEVNGVIFRQWVAKVIGYNGVKLVCVNVGRSAVNRHIE
jgi:hypothetical protein